MSICTLFELLGKDSHSRDPIILELVILEGILDCLYVHHGLIKQPKNIFILNKFHQQ